MVNNAIALPEQLSAALHAAATSTRADPTVRPQGTLPTPSQIIEATNNLVKHIPQHLKSVYIQLNREHLMRLERAILNDDQDWIHYSYVRWVEAQLCFAKRERRG